MNEDVKPASASAMALLVVILAIAVPLIDSDTAAADDDDFFELVFVNVTGRVVTQLDAKGDPVGLSGVTVIFDNGDGTKFTRTTNSNGEFRIDEVAPGTYTITFSKDGYGVLIWPGKAEKDGTSYKVTLTGDETDVFIGNAAMTEAVGTIKGTVYRNGDEVAGVRIELYDTSGRLVKSTITDRYGDYTIQHATGTYYVSVNVLNFMAEPFDVTLGVGVTVNHNFVLEPKRGATYLFGFDLTHSFMVIGGLMGSLIVIFTILYGIHTSRNPGSSKLHSDSKKDQN
ncbi:MAG: carboxypeptidase regulatory-like domain-containing protein [Methanomassiliicoccaceae archaeon]|nr:carboxypeptidase regulatory-like domain-containing protein [Methanomassiliicoccaceae archaeon]